MAADPGLVFAVMAMLSWGLSNFIAKKAARSFSTRALLIYTAPFKILPLLALILFVGYTTDPLYILVAAAVSLTGFFPVIFLYKALRVGKVGIIMPVANSSVIYTVLFSVIFFGEKLQTLQYIAAGLVITGTVLISLRRHTKGLSKGVSFAFVTSLLWGVTFFLWKIPVNVIGPILTSLIVDAGVVFWGVVLLRDRVRFDIGRRNWLIMAVYGFAIIGGSLAWSLSLSLSQVSLVAPIASSNILIATLLARVFYNEKLAAHQYISSILIIAGISLLAGMN